MNERELIAAVDALKAAYVALAAAKDEEKRAAVRYETANAEYGRATAATLNAERDVEAVRGELKRVLSDF